MLTTVVKGTFPTQENRLHNEDVSCKDSEENLRGGRGEPLTLSPERHIAMEFSREPIHRNYQGTAKILKLHHDPYMHLIFYGPN